MEINTVAYGLMMKKSTLTAKAWIEAAYRALTAGGPQAIRAEAIARDLKVSKGSFYWHFENVPSLKADMLQHWKENATEAIIAELEGTDGSAPSKLRKLVEVATSDANAPYGGPLVEAAIRDWARYDDTAASTVKSVDVQRLAYLESLFEQSGLSRSSSSSHATILYGALIGLEALSHQSLADPKNDLRYLLEKLMGRPRV